MNNNSWFEQELQEFRFSFIETLFWVESGDDEGEIDAESELSEVVEEDIKADCRSFYRRAWVDLHNAADKLGIDHLCAARLAGHDFYLTRNHHGAGFWDGDWPVPYGDLFTKISEGYGSFEVYEGDDGYIYLM